MDQPIIPFNEYIASIPALNELRNFNGRRLFAKLAISDKEFTEWLQSMKLLPSKRLCECGNDMVLKYKSSQSAPTKQ